MFKCIQMQIQRCCLVGWCSVFPRFFATQDGYKADVATKVNNLCITWCLRFF